MEQSTLKKLSQILGISVSTVSRALRNHPDIAENTKKKVNELAATLEYEPNNYAIQLRTKKSNLLGILIPTISNFFYDSFISAVEDEARNHGYSVIIMQSRDNSEIEKSNLQFFRKNMVMGLFASVSVETEDMAPFHKMEDVKIPVIFFDRVAEIDEFYKVCLADADAAKIAAETIISRKKKNILGLFGHPHLSISKIRSKTFSETFKELSPKTKLTIDYTEDPATSEKAVLKALKGKNKPDVIFCMGDMILVGVMNALHKLKVKIPEEVAVIGISNGFIPTLYNPKITYVETSGFKLGKLAFKQMMSRINNEDTAHEISVESMLVPGGSL